MNEWVHESIECPGAGPEPDTDAQFESTAQLVAAASKALGIPITRSTVVVHADINSVSRRSDPWPPATRGARVNRVIARANAILADAGSACGCSPEHGEAPSGRPPGALRPHDRATDLPGAGGRVAPCVDIGAWLSEMTSPAQRLRYRSGPERAGSTGRATYHQEVKVVAGARVFPSAFSVRETCTGA